MAAGLLLALTLYPATPQVASYESYDPPAAPVYRPREAADYQGYTPAPPAQAAAPQYVAGYPSYTPYAPSPVAATSAPQYAGSYAVQASPAPPAAATPSDAGSRPSYAPSAPPPVTAAPQYARRYPSDAPLTPPPASAAPQYGGSYSSSASPSATAAPQYAGSYPSDAPPAPRSSSYASSTPAVTVGKTVQLTKVVMAPPAGTVYATLQQGMFCVGGRSLVWNGGAAEQKIATYVTPFHDAMARTGVSTQGDPANLFEQASGEGAAAEFSVGALITDVKLKACTPQPVGANAASSRGEATMTVEWQVFSRLTREVVAKISTQGVFSEPNPVPGGFAVMMAGAFRGSADQLGADPEFQRLLAGPAMSANQLLRPTSEHAPIALSGALSATHRSIDDETQSVVLIYAGEGMGSGFLVSDDGYILTDSHVVGAARQVRLRWADGREEVADVVRTDRARDVALLRADPQGRRPLPLRRDAPGAGETVFAIGAPLGRSFQGTVTRGVISAKRVLQGFSYLQSDISVNPGSSGGPLTDEGGRVIGMTSSGVRLASSSTGINLFIPVGDAIDFLTLQPR